MCTVSAHQASPCPVIPPTSLRLRGIVPDPAAAAGKSLHPSLRSETHFPRRRKFGGFRTPRCRLQRPAARPLPRGPALAPPQRTPSRLVTSRAAGSAAACTAGARLRTAPRAVPRAAPRAAREAAPASLSPPPPRWCISPRGRPERGAMEVVEAAAAQLQTLKFGGAGVGVDQGLAVPAPDPAPVAAPGADEGAPDLAGEQPPQLAPPSLPEPHPGGSSLETSDSDSDSDSDRSGARRSGARGPGWARGAGGPGEPGHVPRRPLWIALGA